MQVLVLACMCAEREHELDIGLHDLLVEAMIGDQVHHAAEVIAALEDVHLIAQLRERRRGAQARRTAADDRNLFPVERRRCRTSECRPVRLAISTMVACTCGMLMDPSKSLREQAAMQKRSGQTRPQTPPSGLLRMISAAERWMIGWIADAGCHDEIKGRAVGGAGLLAGLLLAVFAAKQLDLEALPGHELRNLCCSHFPWKTSSGSGYRIIFVVNGTIHYSIGGG